MREGCAKEGKGNGQNGERRRNDKERTCIWGSREREERNLNEESFGKWKALCSRSLALSLSLSPGYLRPETAQAGASGACRACRGRTPPPCCNSVPFIRRRERVRKREKGKDKSSRGFFLFFLFLSLEVDLSGRPPSLEPALMFPMIFP